MITSEIGSRVFLTSFKTVALGVAAAVTLTACGSPVKMGTAAILGDQRITTAKLDQTVIDWQKQMQQQGKQQGQQQQPADPDSPPRSALILLIGFSIWNEVAREQHIAITPTDIDRIIAANGGQQSIDDQTLSGGLPASHSRDLVRAVLIRSSLLQRFGAVPDQQGQIDPQTQQRLADVQMQAVRTLKIKVNPRFGSFDPNKGLGPVTYALSKADPGLNGAV
jgi:hypothetical protein